MAHIFVVDDDSNILELITEYLRKDGFTVSAFSDGSNLVENVRAEKPDCLILDIMMPGVNGLTLLTSIRTFTEMPIIMISARGEEMDRIIGLELGCNDFLRKPFHPRELIGRVKGMLRLVQMYRSSEGEGQEAGKGVSIGNMTLNEEFRLVQVEGREVSFTSREYELLVFLAKHLERPFSREQLIQQVWKYDFMGEPRVVDDLVKRLRKKLSDAGAGLHIETLWGFGYKVTVKG
ncbi:response regulator transcription factor [Paenibacillus sp. KQZ6P-2]|uniref:Response regulator transcription factor n=1 Tax=Paenibacillus mangrovi TaxID=2931978 RepID=A0A9X1WL59_9BACL|nr:response regulator transcription factor [Paenibacillus mangrovi]MCJ8010899.1 response regulator transcription factor [Paenibacillus mangrovi]